MVALSETNFFLVPIAPQHREFFLSNSKSPVPGKIPVQGFFRSNSKSPVPEEFFAQTQRLLYREKSRYREFFVQTQSLQCRGNVVKTQSLQYWALRAGANKTLTFSVRGYYMKNPRFKDPLTENVENLSKSRIFHRVPLY